MFKGPIVRYGPNRYSINDPLAAKTIYGHGFAFVKSSWYSSWGDTNPHNWALFSDQDEKRHGASRRLYQNMYSMSSLVHYERYVDECADLFSQRLMEMSGPRGVAEPVDMGHWFQCYAFDVIGMVTYSKRLGFLDQGKDIGDIIKNLENHLYYATVVGVYSWLHRYLAPIRNRLGKRGTGRQYIVEFTKGCLAEHQSNPKAIPAEDAEEQVSTMDFLTKFFTKNFADPESFTQYHVLAGCVSNMVAGSDTTAISLSGIMYHLLRNPTELRKLRDEIDTFFSQGKEAWKPISFQESLELPYLQAVIKEALRLHPATGLPSGWGRGHALEDTSLRLRSLSSSPDYFTSLTLSSGMTGLGQQGTVVKFIMAGESPKSTHSTPPAEGHPPNVELVDDLNDGDSSFDEISAFSDTASLESSIFKYRVQNGRTYHAYKEGSYILPNDDRENERLDQQHHLALLTLNHRLFIAPVEGKTPLKRVLDAGCGTGIWSMDFADEHPEAEVTGVDLSPIQPTFVPPNVSFFVDDLEAEWAYGRPFDFIYLRAMTGSIRDWPKLFSQAFENLSPGGYIELMDPIYPATSDDGTVSKDSAVYKWSTLMNEAATKMGSALDSSLRYKDQLTQAGFTNVVETPYKWPMNTWPREKEMKELGAWGNVNLVGGVQGLSLALFTKVLGWNMEELELFLVEVRKDLSNKELHGYWRVQNLSELVSQQSVWLNQVDCLYLQELRLEGSGNTEEGFIKIAKSPILRDLVRELTVDTSVDLEFVYRSNESYPTPIDFLDALPYIRCFGRLTALHLLFDQHCGEDQRTGLDIEETWCFRYRMEIEEKAEDEYSDYERTYLDPEDDLGVPFDQIIKLKELTIANLADYNDTDLANPEAFKKVMSLPSLTNLKMFVATEIDEDSDDIIVYYEEKYEFFQHLPETWLAPSISDNLKVLSLYCQDYWGWFPKMDFRNVEFPQLKVLAFGHYVFSHGWQVDWIFSIGQNNGSGGLRELYLDGCPILFQVYQTSLLDGTDPGYPLVSTVLDQRSGKLHKYSMRWSDVLSKWAISMKELRVFRMGHGQWGGAPQDTLESVRKDTMDEIDEDVLSFRLSNNTHRNFDCPEPLDRDYGDEGPEKAWASGKYLHGTGINERGGCKLQYIEYDISVIPSPWGETSRSYMLDEKGYEPEGVTWAKDHTAFEELSSLIKSRVEDDNGSPRE
ncbi:hypothetical protein FSARC_7634 [Fusarium sarcochroum]|uniref:Uncharacterized protein n=1 Tax=Fusarium sarcochroum TaxID=1208366 RepID=A0A8H4TUY9_9HYPO|nr:hypothetical protein FSARC_7634 [Fusarium sarcochroum]